MNKQGHSNSNSQQSSLIKWRDDFIRSKRLRWSPKTKRCYESILNLYIQYVGEDHWPPTRTGILDWLNSVQEQASETTAATYWRHLKAWLNYLEAVGALDWQSNPIYLIKKLGLQPREADEDYASFDEEELNQLFSYLESLSDELIAKRDLALLRFQYITGCRSGEVAALMFDDLDFSGELPSATIKARHCKNNKFRTVYFNHQVQEDLEHWFDMLRDIGYTNEHIFPSLVNGKPGKPLQSEGIYRMLQRRLKEIELPPRKAHALRHSSALHAIAKGIDIRKIRDQLGHSSIAVTAKYLRKADPDRGIAYKNCWS